MVIQAKTDSWVALGWRPASKRFLTIASSLHLLLKNVLIYNRPTTITKQHCVLEY